MLRVLVPPLALLITSSALLTVQVQQLLSQMAWVEHTSDVLKEGNELYRRVVDEEGGLRGYLLSGERAFLDPYRAGRARVRRGLEHLSARIGDNPQQVAELEQVRAEHAAWERAAEAAIEAPRASKVVPLMVERKEQMDRLRARFEAFLEREERLREARAAAVTRETRASIATGAAVFVLVAAWIAVGARRRFQDLSAIHHRASDAEARLHRLWQSNICGVMYAGATGDILDANDAILGMLGYTREDLRAGRMRWSDMTPPEFADVDAKGITESSKHGGCTPYEKVYIAKDGHHVPILIGYALLDPCPGSPNEFVCIVLDLTERKRIEADREQCLEGERAARSTAERALRIKDEFLAVLSHELRTPLSAIVGWSGMLRRGQRDPAVVARAIEIIDRSAQAEARLIEDLLDVSRIGAGKLRLEAREVVLEEIVCAAAASLQPAVAAKEIELETRLDRDVGVVRADPGRLQQIVWNLLSNAVKFTPKRGHVRLAVRRAGSDAEIVVSDDGQGISADFLPHVFDQFSQADSSTTRRHMGLGLGLALVRKLVEMHGGTVRAESEGEGRGATFTITLPVAAASLPEVGARPVHESSLRGVRVLVVDDDEDTRDLVRRLLVDCEAEVVTVGSACHALDEIQRFRPDVLVSDIGMPHEDGYHLLQELRARDAAHGGGTPAVALTAFGRAEDRARALRCGFQVHLTKPVDPSALIEVVAKLAGRSSTTTTDVARAHRALGAQGFD